MFDCSVRFRKTDQLRKRPLRLLSKSCKLPPTIIGGLNKKQEKIESLTNYTPYGVPVGRIVDGGNVMKYERF